MDKIEAINENVCFECGTELRIDRAERKYKCPKCGKIQYSFSPDELYFREAGSAYEEKCWKIARKDNNMLLLTLLFLSGAASLFLFTFIIISETRLNTGYLPAAIVFSLFFICLCVVLVKSNFRKDCICDMKVLNKHFSRHYDEKEHFRYFVDLVSDRKIPVCIKDIEVPEELYSNIEMGQDVLLTCVSVKYKIFTKKDADLNI